jgi:uncharacterized cupredoxin-like copper-binding protein
VGETPTGALRARRTVLAVTVVVAVTLGFFAFAPSASAHHPEIDGAVQCDDGGGYLVEFLSESWQKSGGNQGGGANPDIRISYRLRLDGGSPSGWIDLDANPAYRYTSQNGYQFTDTFALADATTGNRVQLRAYAAANWGNGQGGGQTTESDWIDFPGHCEEPGVPDVSSSVACTGGDGVVTIELANNGGTESVEFVVTDPRDTTSTTITLDPGQSDTVELAGFSDGGYTISVTADGEPFDQDVIVACDQPGEPDVSSSLECVDGDGDVTITLANTGGTESLVFVVTDPRDQSTDTRTVSPGASTTVVLSGFDDGTHTVGVTADGSAYDQTVEVACDRPGEPEVDNEVECVDGNGDVTITLANAGGDVDVVFVVTDPRDQSTEQRTVSPGDSTTVVLSGFDDGSYTVGVTADGESFDQPVEVACDVPGVPEVSSEVECVDGDGDIAITLANTGGTESIEFVVTDPRDGTTVTRTVDVGDSTSVVLEGFGDGTHTIGITADGNAVDQTVEVACDRPGEPAVDSNVECIDRDGDVTITLSNTGGDKQVIFKVTDPRDGTVATRSVNPGKSKTVVLEGFTDGTHTIAVTAQGSSFDQTVEVACDVPGVPEVETSGTCIEGDGVVKITLRNTGGDKPVEFIVTDPRDGSTQERTLDPGETDAVALEDLADGTYTIEVTADGVKFNQVVDVACDRPGEPEVDSEVECDAGDGDVAITLANTGGDDPVEFVVTDPRDGSTVTRTVDVGDSTTVVLEGFDDGTHTIGVTADGAELDVTVDVACDVPGVPEVDASAECVDFDGEITITLANTDGTEPIEFVVTDPRDDSTVTRTVDVGDTATVELVGFADGTHTIGVTADGVELDQTVDVDCDRPGVPAAAAAAECTAEGGEITVTLENTSPAGEAESIVFVVTDPRDGSETTEAVQAGESKTVVLTGFADGEHAIGVTADGEVLDAVEVTVDCAQPYIDGFTLQCTEGGVILTLGNSGTVPVEVSILVDDVEIATATIPAGDVSDILIPLDEDQKATIKVTSGDDVLVDTSVDFDCTKPEEPTTTTTTERPIETRVLAGGAELGEPRVAGAALPVTGSSLGLAGLGLLLLAVGAGVLVVRRHARED